jgi:hypothetical protein
MTDLVRSESEMILYQTEDGKLGFSACHFEGETLWLTQAQMSELFQTAPQEHHARMKEPYAGVTSTRRQLVGRTYKFAARAAGRLKAQPTPTSTNAVQCKWKAAQCGRI